MAVHKISDIFDEIDSRGWEKVYSILWPISIAAQTSSTCGGRLVERCMECLQFRSIFWLQASDHQRFSSNAWLQWKSNPNWSKPSFWLDLCKALGRTMKVMYSVWDTSRLLYRNLLVCVLQLWPGHSFEASQIYSRMIQNNEARSSMPMACSHFSSCVQRVKGELAQAACLCHGLKVDFLIGLQTGTQEVQWWLGEWHRSPLVSCHHGTKLPPCSLTRQL